MKKCFFILSFALGCLYADLREIAQKTAFVTGAFNARKFHDVKCVADLTDLKDIPYSAFYITDDIALASFALQKGWEPILVTDVEHKNDIESASQAKKFKALPQLFLDQNGVNYDYIFYTDSKLELDVFKILNLIGSTSKKICLLANKHPVRSTAEEECRHACFSQARYNKQQKSYKKYIAKERKHFPHTSHNRLFATGQLLYNMKHPCTLQLQSTWFSHIQRCGIECQISFFFIAKMFEKDIAFIPHPDLKLNKNKKDLLKHASINANPDKMSKIRIVSMKDIDTQIQTLLKNHVKN